MYGTLHKNTPLINYVNNKSIKECKIDVVDLFDLSRKSRYIKYFFLKHIILVSYYFTLGQKMFSVLNEVIQNCIEGIKDVHSKYNHKHLSIQYLCVLLSKYFCIIKRSKITN